jgi:hypothetical protein
MDKASQFIPNNFLVKSKVREFRQLAVTIARLILKLTLATSKKIEKIRFDYAANTGLRIAHVQTVATEFPPITTEKKYWRK